MLLARCCLMFFLAFSASAETSSGEPLEFRTPTGKLSQTGYVYQQRLRDLPTYQGLTEGELELGLSQGPWSAKVTPWFRVWEPQMVGGAPRKVNGYFEIKEGYLDRTGELLDLRVGNQIVAWGAADQINPTDVWNPSDLTDPLNSAKLAQAVVRVKIHPLQYENFQLDLIGSPIFSESRLPIHYPESGTQSISTTASRWLQLPNRVVSGGQSFPLLYEIAERDYPKTWQGGARLQVMRLGGWDFSTAYYNGVEKIPRFAVAKRGIVTDPTLPFLVTLYPSFHRTQIVGLDGAGSLTLGEYELGTRFEIAYTMPNNSRADPLPSPLREDLHKDKTIFGVAGFDYTFQRKILSTILYMNLQYAHYQTLEKKQRNTPGPTLVSGLPNLAPFDRNLIIFLESRIGSTVKLRLVNMVSLQNRDAMLSPSFNYQITDSLKWMLGADLFVGNENGFYGQFSDNRRLKTELAYVF